MMLKPYNRQVCPFNNIFRTFVKAKDHVLAYIFKKYLWAFQKSKYKDLGLMKGKLSCKDINDTEMKQIYRYCNLRRFGVKQNSWMTVLPWLLLWPVEEKWHNEAKSNITSVPEYVLKYSSVQLEKNTSFSDLVFKEEQCST